MGAKVTLLVFAVMMGMWTWQVISYFDFQEQVKQFQSKGPRFTADDGQVLCERIQRIDGLECRYDRSR